MLKGAGFLNAFDFYERIGLAKRVPAVKKKLDKKMFYDYADLNKKEKNVIMKNVERMELSYLLTPSTINIQAFINDEYHIEGVMIVTVQLRGAVTDKHIQLLEEVIHGALPNPVVLTFMYNNELCVSTCVKRLNKVNKNHVVLQKIHRTGWFHGEEDNLIEKSFLNSMELSRLSFTNFYDFYKDIDLAVKAFQDAKFIGMFHVVKDDEERLQHDTIVKKVQEIEDEINKLRNAIKKESQFNKKVEMNIKVQQLKKELETIKSKLS